MVRRVVLKVRIGDGQSHGVIISELKASVFLKFQEKTAVDCLCAEQCGNNILVGRYYVLGDGSDGCSHFGKIWMNKFESRLISREQLRS